MKFRFLLLVIGVLAFIPASAGAQTPYMSRSQMLALTLDVKEDTRALVDYYRSHRPAIALFTDIDQQSPEAPYVEAAFVSGLIRGYDDRTLRIHESVSIEEASAVLLLASGVRLPSASDESWKVTVFQEAISRGLYADISQVTPGQPVTIAQFTDMERRIGLLEPLHLEEYSAPVAATEAVQQVMDSVPVPEETQHHEEPEDIVLSDNYMRTAAHPTQDHSVLQAYRSSAEFAITIPSLGIRDLPVLHPSDPGTSEGVLSVLQNGVGHLFSYPGRGGKIMVYGHSSSYAWDVSPYTKIFRQVNKLAGGDDVYVTYNGQLYHYKVTGQQVIAPTDSQPFTGEGEELLLYTCWPPDSTKTRLVIHAAPVQTVAVR